jgi:hypothetical protein
MPTGGLREMETIRTTNLPGDLRGTDVERALSDKTFRWLDCNVRLGLGTYGNGRLAIAAIDVDDDDVVATLTVNLVGEAVSDGEILVKVWSENATVAEAVRATGLFLDTGRRVRAGGAVAQVWQVRKVVESPPAAG